jgi:hypothetical protein
VARVQISQLGAGRTEDREKGDWRAYRGSVRNSKPRRRSRYVILVGGSHVYRDVDLQVVRVGVVRVA